MSYKPGTALWYALLVWIIGFVWGTVVFMVPALKGIPSVPYVSKFPSISAPLIIAYIPILYFISLRYLEGTGDRAREGLFLGLTILVLNFVLDAAVYYGAFGSRDYFSYLSIWFAYGITVVIPWYTGTKMGAVA